MGASLQMDTLTRSSDAHCCLVTCPSCFSGVLHVPPKSLTISHPCSLPFIHQTMTGGTSLRAEGMDHPETYERSEYTTFTSISDQEKKHKFTYINGLSHNSGSQNQNSHMYIYIYIRKCNGRRLVLTSHTFCLFFFVQHDISTQIF